MTSAAISTFGGLGCEKAFLRVAALSITQTLDALTPPRGEDSGDFSYEALEVAARERLQRALANPHLEEAIALASPELHAALRSDSRLEARVQSAGLRYLLRACGRSTPFGTFAGVCTLPLGRGEDIVVEVSDSWQRYGRLDCSFLDSFIGAVLDLDDARRAIPFTFNDTLHSIGGRYRVFARSQAGEDHQYEVKELDNGELIEYLVKTLPRDFLLGILEGTLRDAGATASESKSLLDALLETQVVVPRLAVAAIGHEPTRALLQDLTTWIPHLEVTRTFAGVVSAIGATLLTDVSSRTIAYGDLRAQVRQLPVKYRARSELHVDSVVTRRQGALSQDLHRTIANSATFLVKAFGFNDTRFEDFANEFDQRFGTDAVPLLEALDPDVGVFFPSLEAREEIVGGGADRQRTLAELIDRGASNVCPIVELDAAELEALQRSSAPPPPHMCAARVRLFSPSHEAPGVTRFVLDRVIAMSPMVTFGRHAFSDREIERELESLAALEAHHAEGMPVELSHLPGARTGNISSRPTLGRRVVTIGTAGVRAEGALQLDDLDIAVRDGRVVVLIRATGDAIAPRLSCAHFIEAPSFLVAYRFLGALQRQQRSTAAQWEWGPFRDWPCLPRVQHGACILTPATWTLSRQERMSLIDGDPARAWAALSVIRERRGLPRLVTLASGENEMVGDLDNPLVVEELRKELKGRDIAQFKELLPLPIDNAVISPDGAHVHDAWIPIRWTASAGHAQPARQRVRPPLRAKAGQEWIYAKLYCASSSIDRLIAGPILAAIRELKELSGGYIKWFFLRYADPNCHIRLRVLSTDIRSRRRILERIDTLASDLLQRNQIQRAQFDMYVPERTRYRGLGSQEEVEHLFWRDSEAIAECLERILASGNHPDALELALYNLECWRAELGIAAEEYERILMAGISLAPGERRLMARQFRDTRMTLDEFLRRRAQSRADLEPLRNRGVIGTPLHRQSSARVGRAGKDDEWSPALSSLLHMSTNRLVARSSGFIERQARDHLSALLRGWRARGIAGM